VRNPPNPLYERGDKPSPFEKGGLRGILRDHRGLKSGMKLSHEEARRIALLARVGITEAEAEKLREQLSNILENFEILQEVDTTNVLPTAQVTGLENVVREDESAPSLSQKEILTNAPREEEGFFRIKAVLE